jgi:tetratricopeptide (TPR) repeat protein
MNALFLALLLQSSLVLPPRAAVENPATVSQVPAKLKKDYDKMWGRFISAKEDAKLLKDLEKFLQKQKTFDPAWMIQGYLYLYKGDETAARQRFTEALVLNPKNRIAMYYLAELAYARGEYARAATFYAQLQSIAPNHPEIETKLQKANLLATDNLLRAAARSESENRFGEAEEFYRQALRLAPNEPALLSRLADLLAKQNKKEEADAVRKAMEDLRPRHNARTRQSEEARQDDLEDLGRWGSGIDVFHQIRDAEAISREQFVILMMRYFPQLEDFSKTPQIVTDIQNSPSRAEIQTVVNVGLIELLPNHDFQPSQSLSRGDLALALARLSRLLGVPAGQPSVSATDVAVSNAMYGEIQLVLGYGIMTPEDSGNFNSSGLVSGRQAVDAVGRLLRIFQQGQR